jgi:hypothetical protein
VTAAAWALSCVLSALSAVLLTLWVRRGSSRKAHEEGYFEAMRDLPNTMAVMTDDELATLGSQVAELRGQ